MNVSFRESKTWRDGTRVTGVTVHGSYRDAEDMVRAHVRAGQKVLTRKHRVQAAGVEVELWTVVARERR